MSTARTLRLNVLLAKTEYSSSQFKKMISDFVAFFKNKQTDFKGVKKTYTPREGTIDEPSMRGNVVVVTTVAEKLQWLEENAGEHINNLFSVEATNASGTAKARLVVEGIDFGEFSSLELLRLKSLLEAGEIEGLYQHLPVRTENEIWNKTTEENYKERDIYSTDLAKGIKRSGLRESYILPDPNVDKLKNPDGYKPQIGVKETIIEMGEYTLQHFSGEISHRERADMLKRRSKLLQAVVEALKVANEVEVVQSLMTAEKIFGYLHRGKI